MTVRRHLARIGPLRRGVRRIRQIRRARPIKIDGAGPIEGMRLRIPWGYRMFYAAGDYEQHVAAALERLVQPGDVCADVGAHVGYFTLLLARLVGETGRVFSFEALPENEAAVRANIALNHLEHRVTSQHAAVVEKSGGAIPLFDPGHFVDTTFEWTTSLDFASREDEETTPRDPLMVPAVALDDVVPLGTPLNLVKMDIEGAEGRALSGMARILREVKPIILLELHGEEGWPGAERLLEAGYAFESLRGEPLPAPQNHTEVPNHFVARPHSGGTSQTAS